MNLTEFRALCRSHNAKLSKRENIYHLTIAGVSVSALAKPTTTNNLVAHTPAGMLMSKLQFEGKDNQAVKDFHKAYRQATEFVYPA